VKRPALDFVHRITRIGLSVGIVGAITFLYFKVASVNSTTVALTLLLAVLGIAARWGLIESMIASIVGMLCFNYFFLPPVGKWSIADPQNWVALFAFVVTASVASQLSASAAKKAAEATHRQHEMEQLYVLSRSLLLLDGQSSFATQIARHIAEVYGFQNVVCYDRAAGEAAEGDVDLQAEVVVVVMHRQGDRIARCDHVSGRWV